MLGDREHKKRSIAASDGIEIDLIGKGITVFIGNDELLWDRLPEPAYQG